MPFETKEFVNRSGVEELIKLVQQALDLKVDTESGKGLSTNDFTTAFQTKLSNLANVPEITGTATSTGSVTWRFEPTSADVAKLQSMRNGDYSEILFTPTINGYKHHIILRKTAESGVQEFTGYGINAFANNTLDVYSATGLNGSGYIIIVKIQITDIDGLTFDNEPLQSSTNPVKSSGIYSSITNSYNAIVPITAADITAMWDYNTYVQTYIDYQNASNCRIVAGIPSAFHAYKDRKRCTVADDGTITSWYGDANFAEDGSMGQVMVYQPKFYYKVEPVTKDANPLGGYHIRTCNYYLSDYPIPGFKLHPAFINEAGNVVDYVLISAYEGCLYDTSASAYITDDSQVMNVDEDKLSSIANVRAMSGETTSNNLTRANSEKLAQNRGAGWHSETFKVASVDQMLFIIEYASANSQLSLGNGVAFGSDPDSSKNCSSYTGSTSSLGNASGNATITKDWQGTDQTAANKLAVSYRGKENAWGNIWTFAMGLNAQTASSAVSFFVCNDFTFTEGTSTGFTDVGFKSPTTNNYVTAFGYGNSDTDWVFIGSEYSSGSANGVIGDYNYHNTSNGWYVALLGGRWYYAGYAGLMYWIVYNAASARARYIGARLCYYPQT